MTTTTDVTSTTDLYYIYVGARMRANLNDLLERYYLENTSYTSITITGECKAEDTPETKQEALDRRSRESNHPKEIRVVGRPNKAFKPSMKLTIRNRL